VWRSKFLIYVKKTYFILAYFNFQDIPVDLLKENERVSPEYVEREKSKLILIDTRTPGEFAMCKIEDSSNFPYGDFDQQMEEIKNLVGRSQELDPSLKGTN